MNGNCPCAASQFMPSDGEYHNTPLPYHSSPASIKSYEELWFYAGGNDNVEYGDGVLYDSLGNRVKDPHPYCAKVYSCSQFEKDSTYILVMAQIYGWVSSTSASAGWYKQYCIYEDCCRRMKDIPEDWSSAPKYKRNRRNGIGMKVFDKGDIY